MTADGGSNGYGTVFQVNTDGTGYTILHNFAGGPGDGASPKGSLTLSGSTLYGMTWAGGSSGGGGTVFKINTDGTGYAILQNLAGDGANPPRVINLLSSQISGSLTLSGSTLYGMTLVGGSNYYGTVFQVNTDGTGYTILHNFAGGPGDGASPLGSLTLSGSTLYGMTDGGGSNGGGVVFAFVARTDGVPVTISGNTGVDGVTMSGLPGNPITSGGGSYTASVSNGWSGTVTPTKTGYTFTPPSRTYNSITSDQLNQNYTATAASGIQFGVDYRNPYNGVATATAGVDVNGIKDAGKQFVCEYIGTADNDGYLRPTDVAALTIQGLQIVSIFERTPTSTSYFTLDNADYDATVAISAAIEAGQPSGSAIYFTVDFDPGSDLASLSAIDSYFQEIRKYFNQYFNANSGITYDIGIYAPGDVLQTIMNDASVGATYSWWAKPFGTTGSNSYSSANLAQVQDSTAENPIVIGGVQVDLDEAYTANFGQWGGSITPLPQFGTLNGKNFKQIINNVTFGLTGGGLGVITGDNFDQIILDGTGEKSQLTVSAKTETSVGDIIVNGTLKGISAKNVNLRGNISITGSLSALTLNDVADNHTITIGSSTNPKAAVTMTFDRVAGLTIDSQIPIKSISATDWSSGSINAPSIGSITTKGDKKRSITGDLDVNVMLDGSINSVKVAGTLSGGWTCNSVKSISAMDVVEANLILSQQPDSKVKVLALGSLIAKGWIDSSQILSTGNIGAVTAGAIIDSNCFAGVAEGITGLPAAEAASFSETATIKSVAVKGIKGVSKPYYINSNIAAVNILSAYLNYPENDNNGIPFGLSAGYIKALKIKDSVGTKSSHPINDEALGDFEILLY